MDFGFSPDVEEFNLRFQRCRVSQEEVASTSATTGFKLVFKKQASSTVFAQTLEE